MRTLKKCHHRAHLWVNIIITTIMITKIIISMKQVLPISTKQKIYQESLQWETSEANLKLIYSNRQYQRNISILQINLITCKTVPSWFACAAPQKQAITSFPLNTLRPLDQTTWRSSLRIRRIQEPNLNFLILMVKRSLEQMSEVDNNIRLLKE